MNGQSRPRFQPGSGKFFLAGLALTGWLVMLAMVRFEAWLPKVFYGDDLANYLAWLDGYFASSLQQMWFEAPFDKYRPVFAMVLGVLFKVFALDIHAYHLVNIAMLVASALVIFKLARQLSGGSVLLGVCAASLVASSRFALYQVTQVTGILEGLGQLLFVLLLYALFRVETTSTVPQRPPWRTIAPAALLLLALTLTHERYVVLVPWVCLVMMCKEDFRISGLHKMSVAFLLLAVPSIAAFFFKALILHSSILVGTGGTKLGLDLMRVGQHFVQAASSVAGFNYGPEYLVGDAFAARPQSSGFSFALVCVLTQVVIIALYLCFTKKVLPWRTSRPLADSPLLLLSLPLVLLIPPMLTIRMEQRWLAQPFIVTLLLVAMLLGFVRQRFNKTGLALGLLFAVFYFAVDTYAAKSFSRVFFVSSASVANIVKRDFVDARSHDGRPLVLVAGHDHCSWTLLEGGFFRLYKPARSSVTCVDALAELNTASRERLASQDTYVVQPDKAVADVGALLQKRAARREEKLDLDFLRSYGSGQISSDTRVDTPSGKGASILAWPAEEGDVPSLTVLTGFSYRFAGIAVSPGQSLRFDLAMPFKTKSAPRALIRIQVEGGSAETVFSKVLPIQASPQRLEMTTESLALDRFAGRKIWLEFSVESPGEDQSGHWVAFFAPRIVR